MLRRSKSEGFLNLSTTNKLNNGLSEKQSFNDLFDWRDEHLPASNELTSCNLIHMARLLDNRNKWLGRVTTLDDSIKARTNEFKNEPLRMIFSPRTLKFHEMCTFLPPEGEDVIVKSGVEKAIATRHQCITAMHEYRDKSLEELRYEHYLTDCKLECVVENEELFNAPIAMRTEFGPFEIAYVMHETIMLKERYMKTLEGIQKQIDSCEGLLQEFRALGKLEKMKESKSSPVPNYQFQTNKESTSGTKVANVFGSFTSKIGNSAGFQAPPTSLLFGFNGKDLQQTNATHILPNEAPTETPGASFGHNDTSHNGIREFPVNTTSYFTRATDTLPRATSNIGFNFPMMAGTKAVPAFRFGSNALTDPNSGSTWPTTSFNTLPEQNVKPTAGFSFSTVNKLTSPPTSSAGFTFSTKPSTQAHEKPKFGFSASTDLDSGSTWPTSVSNTLPEQNFNPFTGFSFNTVNKLTSPPTPATQAHEKPKSAEQAKTAMAEDPDVEIDSSEDSS